MDGSPARSLAEAGAVVAVVGSLAKILPPLAAAFAVAWYGVQIWESPVGKRWRLRWRQLLVERSLTIEDRLAFLWLALAGSGAFLAMLAVSRIIVE